MAEFLAFAAVAILVPAALALLLDRIWPGAPTGRLALAASLVLPVALGLLFLAAYLDAMSRPPNPDRVDGGLEIVLTMLMGPIVVMFAWAFGLPAAFETLERRRRKRDP